MDTYEKKYKEIVGLIKKAYLYAQTESTKAVLEEIFPEIKESEDERIKEAIIATIHLYYGEPLEDEAKEMLAWLGKQGEQKPVVIIPKFRIGDNIKTTNEEPLTITKIDDKGYWSEDLLVCDFDDAAKWELVEQKPADKIEQKFKVGDWIVNKGHSYLIADIDYEQRRYLFEIGGYTHEQLNWEYIENADNKYHLWTIQDAKDGDVLVNGSNIFIFHFLSDTRLMGYCHINTDDGRFYDDLGKNECFCLIDAVVTPATKEQRDLLFAKMKEEGYEWDEEKKELKKVSQRMISAEVKEAMYAKPAWSEEDEQHIDSLLKRLDGLCRNEFERTRFAINEDKDWLESLKQRIGG